MSFTTGSGLGSKSEDMLAVIMKQLAAMDARLQSMEGCFHAVDSIQAQVTALEESTGELGAQHDTLSSVVERIDLAQTRLTAAADRAAAESRQQTPRTVTIRAAADDRGVTREVLHSPPDVGTETSRLGRLLSSR
jgi:septal ring factor EnvC (AmiA/AmiB activator)